MLKVHLFKRIYVETHTYAGYAQWETKTYRCVGQDDDGQWWQWYESDVYKDSEYLDTEVEERWQCQNDRIS